MTCGQGSAFCNNKCTPQFSLGTCPVQNVTHNKLYKWWETDGPGGSRNGRLFSPDDFPTNAAGKALAARMNSTLHARQLVPNGIKPIGAACVVTAADGWGGCASSCCLKGICQACDKCAPNPLKDSSRCKWCMRNNRTISNEGCLLRGDKCTTNGLAPGNPISRCRSGCCKLGVCTWCENCAMGCKCAANGTQELNPGGRCVTKTSSTTRTRTTSKSRTRTRTTTRLPPPIYDGNGKGKGMVITGCPGGRRVAITFDDGPFLYTQQLLDTLDNLGAKVTFFVNGKNYGNIDDRKYLIERMKNSGHCIGSHGWLHKSMPELGGYAAQLNNLVQLDQALWEILRGIRPRYFRPPFGNYNQDTINAARHVGYDVVMWNLDANDW